MNTIPFSVSKASDQPEVSSSILSIHSRPIKFLGRIIDGSISDRNSSAELKDKLLTGLTDLPSYPHLAGFSRIFKTFQHPARISYVKPYSHIFKIIKHFTPCVNFILFRMIECDKMMFYTPGFVYSSCVLPPSSSANFDSYVRIN